MLPDLNLNRGVVRFQAFVSDASYKGLPTEYRVPVYKIMLRESGPQNGVGVYNNLMMIFNRAETHPEKLQVCVVACNFEK